VLNPAVVGVLVGVNLLGTGLVLVTLASALKESKRTQS
jgi:hypothetical protein